MVEKEGSQKLTLVIYQLVKIGGEEHWPVVETYRADININVTLGQRLMMLDWKWVIGILVTALLIPALWRWIDKRNKEKEKAEKDK